MPRVPTYDLAVRGGGSGPGSPDMINLGTPWANAVTGTGQMLENRAEKMLAEYDSAKALEAYNSYSDQSRAKMLELSSRESGSAFGIQKEFEEWERTTRSKIESGIITAAPQQHLFSRMADRHRGDVLNSLATHEFHQTRIYKTEQMKGFASNIDRDIPPIAKDEAAVEAKLLQYEMFGAGLFPGHDRTADNAAAREVFRVTQGHELIRTDPRYATQWLELPNVKRELGDKYDALKKALQSQVAEDTKSAAYTEAVAKFGANYAAIEHYFEQPAQVNRLGYKTSMELANQAATIRSRRQTEEDRGITLHKRNQEQTFDRMMAGWYALTPGQPPPDFLGALQRGEISSTQYEHWKTGKQSATADDLATYNHYRMRVARGEDTPELRNALIAEPMLSEQSKKTMLNAMADDGIKKGYADIAHVTGAGTTYPTEDQKLKGFEMSKKYEMRLLRGESWRVARDAVIDEYTRDLKVSKQRLPISTKHLDMISGKRDDAAALESALRAAAATFAQKTMDANMANNPAAAEQALREYNDEVNDLKNMLQVARSEKLLDDVAEKERQEKRRKDEEKRYGGKLPAATLPGASY